MTNSINTLIRKYLSGDISDDEYKEMADNLFISGIMSEKEYTSVIYKKEKNRNDFER